MNYMKKHSETVKAIVVLMLVFGTGMIFNQTIREPEIKKITCLEYVEVPTYIYTTPIRSITKKMVSNQESIESTENTNDIKPQDICGDFDILTPCGYSAEELTSALNTEAHQELVPYIDTFLEAEETYGVNAFYLMCKFGYESGWGRHMAGKNNIGGWSDGKGGWQDFESVEHCIMHIAKCLSTTYKEKVGSSLVAVSKRYCPTDGYLEQVMLIMNQRTNAINERGV